MNTLKVHWKHTPRTYVRIFASEAVAVRWCNALNEFHASGDGQQFVVAPNPAGHAVVSIDSAIPVGESL